MTIQITVPELGESVIGATIGEWHKEEGDTVAVGELLVELETDKVDVEVAAETAGVLVSIRQPSGADVEIGDVLAEINPDETAVNNEQAAPTPTTQAAPQTATQSEAKQDTSAKISPVAQRLAEEKSVDINQINGSGTNGRITRQDVENFLNQQAQPTPPPPAPKSTATPTPVVPAAPTPVAQPENGREERIRLSRRRRTIAQRLVEAQQTAAMLTTFNDVDMSAVINLRKQRGPAFLDRNGVKLGFMSFFVKSVVGALKAFPRLNAEIDGDEMVLKHYYDIGIAVGAEEGLVVPVLRDADRKSFAQVEQSIRDYAVKARDNSLSLADLRGGTFTITNGGIFGSMLSTPILNPPQVGILGMHRIDERPIAVNGEVVIRPMMYLALSYDHRIIDGREAVQFLARIKEFIEDPEALLLEG